MTAVAGLENIEHAAARRRERSMTVMERATAKQNARPARRLPYTDCRASSTTPLR